MRPDALESSTGENVLHLAIVQALKLLVYEALCY
jgi:hypothetical protein